MKDTSNIFKLPPKELETKKSSLDVLWDDTAPEIVDFARKLQGLLQSVDTPYVIGLDGGYGTGKTHFATRFAAQMHEQIKTIYFSAWEKDYEKELITVFLEQIANLIKTDKKYIESSQIKNIKSLLKSLWVAIESISVNSPITKFPISMTFNVEHFRRQLNKLTIKEDMLQNAKRELANYIKSLPHEKMVLIVDDLDRCRPDTAVKILETVKHFFDIDGLIVVMPINQSRLRQYIDAFYGIGGTAEQKGVVAEDYLQKFFNDIIDIPNLNYEKICADRITEEEFRSNLVYEGDSYNNIQELRKWIAEYAKKSHFSYRETVELINRAKLFCNTYHEPIRCRLLAYQLCNRLHKEKNKMRHEYNDIDYGEDNVYKDCPQNTKKKLFSHHPAYQPLSSINNRFGHLARIRLRAYVSTAGQIHDTYADVYKQIKHLIKLVSDISETDFRNKTAYNNYIKPELEVVVPALKTLYKELREFQRKHGSDDSDLDRAKDYELKVYNPHLLGDK
ncbi:MAG: hypothetical protein J6R52_01590 [Alphaproteobacteria bacterium]|nr:hypothetical protein [Alphaproteobacteria bacterium]